MKGQHNYNLTVKWTGNNGTGTSDYRAFKRSYTIIADNKVEILGSSDPAFLGDKTKYNPEDLLVASLSSCHMLWYLHLCADAGIVVTDYVDNPKATMQELETGGGYFSEVILYPNVKITDVSKIELANSLHDKAHQKCFIANSCNFPVTHQPHSYTK